MRGRRRRRRHVRAGGRAPRRRRSADRSVRPSVPDHGAVRPAARAAADAARPRQPRLLPHRGRRARDGRLRAQARAVGARRDPRRLRGEAPAGGVGPDAGAVRERDHARSRDGDRRGEDVLQRARGVHARRGLPARRDGCGRLLGGGGRLRARSRRRRRDREDHERMDRRRATRVGRVAARHPPLRAPVPEPAVHARALVRGALAVLRHQVSRRGEAGRAPVACLAGVRAPQGARRRVRRERRLGAGQLVRVERGARRRGASSARLGRRELVARDRGRGARRARVGRALRPVELLEARGARARSARLPRAAVREQDRPAGRHDRLHAAPEQARRDRGGSVGAAPRRRPLPARHRHSVWESRSRLAREARPARRLGLRQRRHVCVRVSLPLGTAGARRPAAA